MTVPASTPEIDPAPAADAPRTEASDPSPDPSPWHRLSLDAVRRAADVIDPVFARSPQYVDPGPSAALGCRLTVKLETANPLRSLKGRGANAAGGQLRAYGALES